MRRGEGGEEERVGEKRREKGERGEDGETGGGE